MRRDYLSTTRLSIPAALAIGMAFGCALALAARPGAADPIARLTGLIGSTLAKIREAHANPAEGTAAARRLARELGIGQPEPVAERSSKTAGEPQGTRVTKAPHPGPVPEQPSSKGLSREALAWRLLETIELRASEARRFETKTVLAEGQTYRIEASGAFSAGGGEPIGADAVYCYRAGPCSPPQTWQQLRIDGRGVNEIRSARAEAPLAYSPEHLYPFEIDGAGAPLTLHLWDAIEAGSAADNAGSIKVDILGPTLGPPLDRTLGSPQDGVTVVKGETLAYHPAPTAASCRLECAARSDCVGYTWVKPNGYGTGEPAVCYLMGSIEQTKSHRCCVTAIKSASGTRPTRDGRGSGLTGRWRWRTDCSGGVSEGEWTIAASDLNGPFTGQFEGSDINTDGFKGVSGDTGSAHGGLWFERHVAGRVQEWSGTFANAAQTVVRGSLTDPTHPDCRFVARKCLDPECRSVAEDVTSRLKPMIQRDVASR